MSPLQLHMEISFSWLNTRLQRLTKPTNRYTINCHAQCNSVKTCDSCPSQLNNHFADILNEVPITTLNIWPDILVL